MAGVVISSKRDSTVVTVLCALALAGAFVAIALSFIPHLGTVAVVITLPAFLVAATGTALALARNTKMVLPAVTLLLVGFPAAKDNWHDMQIVWVESEELCQPPTGHGGILGGLLDMAIEADYGNAVSANICGQLGKRETDHNCDGRVGRIKCEP